MAKKIGQAKRHSISDKNKLTPNFSIWIDSGTQKLYYKYHQDEEKIFSNSTTKT